MRNRDDILIWEAAKRSADHRVGILKHDLYSAASGELGDSGMDYKWGRHMKTMAQSRNDTFHDTLEGSYHHPKKVWEQSGLTLRTFPLNLLQEGAIVMEHSSNDWTYKVYRQGHDFGDRSYDNVREFATIDKKDILDEYVDWSSSHQASVDLDRI